MCAGREEKHCLIGLRSTELQAEGFAKKNVVSGVISFSARDVISQFCQQMPASRTFHPECQDCRPKHFTIFCFGGVLMSLSAFKKAALELQVCTRYAMSFYSSIVQVIPSMHQKECGRVG